MERTNGGSTNVILGEHGRVKEQNNLLAKA
jgi:hypothetical protein